MKKFNQQKFNQFIIENKVIGFFEKPVLLKSKRESHFYINWRNVLEDVWLTDKLLDFVLDFVEDLKLKVDCFLGIPEGATKLGILVQYKFAKKSKNFKKGKFVLPMIRAKEKEHGMEKDRYFLGVPRGKIILLEDVTTTGSSIFEAIEKLKKVNLKPEAVISLTNRMEKTLDLKNPKEILEKEKIKFFEMSKATELLPIAIKKLKPKKEIVQKIVEEFERFGVEKLKI